jgi:hypothetical protein
MPMLVGKRVWAALSDVRRQPICRRGFVQLEVCARFGSHLLSPHVTSGGPAAGGVLMVKPMGAICS